MFPVINKSPKPRNILKGVLGVASVFDTNPSNLANATDGNTANPTGEGSKVVSGAGDVGYVVFDMKKVTRVLPFLRTGTKTTASTISVYLDACDANPETPSNWRLGVTNYATGSTVEMIKDLVMSPVEGRYLRVRFSVAASATGTGKIYEMAAYELGV